MNSAILMVFEFVVLIFSAVLHEVAHGYTAQWLGDDTAERAGRLTLNPIKHLDLFGSILMPIALYLASGGTFFFAAAKPVPYNPNNLKDPRSGGAKIALAGPLTNFVLAAIFGLLVRGLSYTSVSPLAITLFEIVCYVNIVLGVFNLVPIPPLDGSRVLFALLPQTPRTMEIMYTLERFGLILVIVFVFVGFALLAPVMAGIFTLFTGQPLM
ncbi:MAG TPA: site-2 protease family protein [Candidatus Paceibacterota bacterium]|nr:site-2 protease family protein [Candidatus Paceibacterota bacterium]